MENIMKIELLKNDSMILVRKSFLDICGGDTEAAILLSYLTYWHNKKAEKAKNSADISKFLQYHTKEKILQETLGLLSHRGLMRARVKLKDLGFIAEYNNPKYKFDRTIHYLVNTKAVNNALKALNKDESQEAQVDETSLEVASAAASEAPAEIVVNEEEIGDSQEDSINDEVKNNDNKKDVKKDAKKGAKITLTQSFNFYLDKKLEYEELPIEYKEKLFLKCLLLDKANNYSDFIAKLKAGGYKYKNFVSAYQAWYKIKGNGVQDELEDVKFGNRTYKQIKFEDKGVVYAVEPITLDYKMGRLKKVEVEIPKEEQEGYINPKVLEVLAGTANEKRINEMKVDEEV